MRRQIPYAIRFSYYLLVTLSASRNSRSISEQESSLNESLVDWLAVHKNVSAEAVRMEYPLPDITCMIPMSL